MESQLQFCRDLFQAVLRCQQCCSAPAAFNTAVLHTCQCLMLEAVQLQQEAAIRAVRQCLEAVLQLLSRVNCLGPIEAFFTADDLLMHYQRHVDAATALNRKLYQQRQQTSCASTISTAAVAGSPSNCNGGDASCASKLALPEQQLRIIKTFRSYAAQVRPRLICSCSSQVVQQLCEVVKQGLVMIHGYSFLLGQEWQHEVSAMFGRAEQLKVLLAHQQAHHLSLLAALLQHMHHQETLEFDGEQGLHSLHSSASCGQQQLQQLCPPLFSNHSALSGSGSQSTAQCQKQQAISGTFDALADEDDEFYIPVAPLAISSPGPSTPGSSTAAALAGPGLPFDLLTDGSITVDLSEDSLARMPSSGCSSLLEYVHTCTPGCPSTDGTEAPGSHQRHSAGAGGCYEGRSSTDGSVIQLRRITEEQLQSIAGPEAAPALAAALGVVLQGSRDGSRCSLCNVDPSRSSSLQGNSDAGSSSRQGASNTESRRESDSALFSRRSVHSSSMSARILAGDCTGGGIDIASRQMSDLVVSSSGGSRGASPLSRNSSTSLSSSPGISKTSSGPGLMWCRQQQQQQHSTSAIAVADSAVAHQSQQPWTTSSVISSSSSQLRSITTNSGASKHAQSTLRLQHTCLPVGCCKSLGAVLYMSPQIQRLELVNVGIDDQAVVHLVDALKVNSSVVLLDLSCNTVDDIGARALGKLLQQHNRCSSRLRVLCLQHNAIGDDGAIALSQGLAGNTELHRLWLQHNAIGQPGAMALATAMQHNTACTDLKLLKGNGAVSKDVGEMAEKLALHNRGVRDRIKGLLKRMLKSEED